MAIKSKHEITDEVPSLLLPIFLRLREKLDVEIPRKILNHNLIIATWNIRFFGGLTELWDYNTNKSPKRNLFALRCIAEIISRFDVVAIQEVKGKLMALRHMLKVLGPDWGVMMTDVTDGDLGNGERIAFVFDRRKVQLSGLACELVVPVEVLRNEAKKNTRISPGVLDRQFARTPYAVSFKSGKSTFILVALHIFYGTSDKPKKRIPELTAIAEWMFDWANDMNAYHQNFIALGDFNIDSGDDKLCKAFLSTGLKIPKELENFSRSIYDTPKFYDHIAWFMEDSNSKTPALSMTPVTGGMYDFMHLKEIPGLAEDPENLTKDDKDRISWYISDHFPLWYEFDIQKGLEKPATDARKKRAKLVTTIKPNIDNAVNEFITYLVDNGNKVPNKVEVFLEAELNEIDRLTKITAMMDSYGVEKGREKLTKSLISLAKKVEKTMKKAEKTKVTLKIVNKELKKWKPPKPKKQT